ncbi:nuclear transport factor 2 family protein [Aquimarina sp. AU58]|uniref:nuclear transport factor 2 family protein n=1 Tax=Aquimarina sp. AU58 TaxID=1874112 RepID=UPI000D6E54B3|nr:nuclear transport factor 2 family protein [Aquimarina sp. AU58]
MKRLFFTTFPFCFLLVLSQYKMMNHDKTIINNDTLLYKSTNEIVKTNHSFSEKEMIEKTLNNYIQGSSYNELEKLESAFAADASLYLTVKGTFKRLTPVDYINYFKNKKKGVYNGRTGNILSIEIYRDIATAKVEIFIPERKTKLMDLFLLKKLKGDWKIITKTATKL